MIMIQVMASCGVTDESRIEAMVGLTIGIPWYRPPWRGDLKKGGLLFPLAAKEAANRCTHGAVKPADIFDAAMTIDGHCTSEQGHVAERRWVGLARESVDGMRLTLEDMLRIPGPGSTAARLLNRGFTDAERRVFDLPQAKGER